MWIEHIGGGPMRKLDIGALLLLIRAALPPISDWRGGCYPRGVRTRLSPGQGVGANWTRLVSMASGSDGFCFKVAVRMNPFANYEARWEFIPTMQGRIGV